MQLTGAIKAEYDTSMDKPQEIFVDAIGLGAGVADRLRELGLPAYAINVSESPAMGTTYLNLRAELWYKARGWLEGRDTRLPKDDRLRSELTTLRYTYTSSGKIKIESKQDLKRRGVSSPDAADACVLTFASDAGTAIGGGWYLTSDGTWFHPDKTTLEEVEIVADSIPTIGNVGTEEAETTSKDKKEESKEPKIHGQ